MKAAIFYGPGDIRVEQFEKPVCPDGGALLNICGTTICGSDTKIYKNGHPKINPPLIIGHECCAEIVEIKAKQTHLKLGDRVTMQTSIPCGSCEMCMKGIFNLCVGIKCISLDYHGTFAQYTAVPAKALEMGNIIKVPENLTDEEVCLAEPLACVINSQNFLNIEPGQSVLIIGAGPTGILQAELAKRRGAGEIFVAQRSANRLKQAQKFNYSAYIDTNKDDLVESIMQLTKGKGVDICIVTAPVHAVQQQAIKTLAYRGKLSLFGSLGVGNSEIAVDSRLIHYKEISVFGAASSTSYQMHQALKILSAGGIRTSDLITHTLPLERIVEGINLSLNGESLKVYIKND